MELQSRIQPFTFGESVASEIETLGINFGTINFEGNIYLSICNSAWKVFSKSPFLEEDSDLEAVSTSDGVRVRESSEPLRSALLSLAVKRGESWLSFDERMDTMAADALRRVKAFIEKACIERCPPTPTYVYRITQELPELFGISLVGDNENPIVRTRIHRPRS